MQKQFNKITIPSLLLATTIIQGATFNVTTTPELRTALEISATNGEDDTIILADGTYKTTDDGKGTFIYFSNEDKNLTIQGSSADNVILSGDNQNQILNHNSTKDAPMKIAKLTFVDGNNTDGNGGAVYSDYKIDVIDSNFTNNSATYGGGFFSYSDATITNSTFTANSASDKGGGFLSYSDATVTNSTFTNNSATYGGGFYSYLDTTVTVRNSTFTGNNASYGGGAICSNNIKASNLLIKGNSNGIYLYSGEDNVIINSIFIDNNSSDISGSTDVIISNLENNYIDLSKVSVSSFKSNNIFDGINLGFSDEENGDYTLTSSSDLIDAGTTDIDGFILPDIDLAGNQRVSGSSIDIGVYEFNSTKPTITDSTAPLAFEEMTLEQKLASLTTDQTKINSIIADINDGETVSTALSSDDITNLPKGWSNIGTKAPISDLSIFSSANIVWTYNNSNSSWSAYSPDSNINSLIQKSNISTITQIPANSGIWVLIK